MPAPPLVLELVERFRLHRDAYVGPRYNETQVRREFVDPFFKALGWDVDNEQGYAEAYKDVIHEDALKVGQSTRAPDYCFRIGGVRKFFVETKKPAVDLKQDPLPAFQLRRYAWSAKLPLSILTDFDELCVYNCRVKPVKTDKASKERVLYFRCEEYEERWDEIADVFSREAILRGSFDKYAESKTKRGTSEVDDAFLEEIERWRELLARNLALRNPQLEQRELNEAVQKTIDRIVFLRIAEDRGIEDANRLQGLVNGPHVYRRLCELFEQADVKYNSGLFHFSREKGREDFDEWTLSLDVDDKPLREIIGHLYYPDSPYEFSVLPADILGQVYERFLGKVIRLTKGHRAVVEEKPEVRKAGGVYYTPTYIVDYIVRNTVGKLVEGKTAFEVAGRGKNWLPLKTARPLSVLDPACGSGTFLIGAYQFLLDWYRDWYAANDPARWLRMKSPTITEVPHSDPTATTADYRLTTTERKRILLDHVFGVDIDPQAVEVTKLSLLLKVLEGESRDTLQRQLFAKERALPDLADNIKCGNSLIGPEFYDGRQTEMFDDEELLRVNAFEWTSEFSDTMNSGGFDAVIGNPPYDVLEKDRGKSSWPHAALVDHVRTCDRLAPALGGKLNLFRFFAVQSFWLLREGGAYGNILPLALLADISCAGSRKHVLSQSADTICSCFPQKDNRRRRVFVDAKLSTVVLTCFKESTVTDRSAKLTVRVYPWNSFDDPHTQVTVRLQDTKIIDPKNTPIPLVDERAWRLCLKLHRHVRVARMGDVPGVAVRRGEINQTVYRRFISDNVRHSPLLKGVEVGQYELRDRLSQGKREWFDERAFLKEHSPHSFVDAKRIATQRITGVDERLRIVATIIVPPMYFADSTNSIVVDPSAGVDTRYVLGLLNSCLFQWRFKITSSNNNVGVNELNAMPFRLIDVSESDEATTHKAVVSHVQILLDGCVKLRSCRGRREEEVVRRRIDSTRRKLDRLVYELYGLTDDEVRIVEGAGAGA